MLSAGLVMGIMIVPYVSSVSEDAMRAVPMALREGAYAMGATRLGPPLTGRVPAAFSGIVAAYHPGDLARRRRDDGRRHRRRHAAQPDVESPEPAATITAFIVQVSSATCRTAASAIRPIFAAGLTLFLMTLVFNVLGHLVASDNSGRPTEMRDRRRHATDDPVPDARRNRWVSVRRLLGWLRPARACSPWLLFVRPRHRRACRALSRDFFTSFPSRRAAQAGILSAWVGSLW